MSVDVELTGDELVLATEIANGRMISATAANRDPSDYQPRTWGDRWSSHLLGVCGEIVVARHLNRYWPATTTYVHGAPDIPPNIEVRTGHRTTDSLIVGESDNPARWYCLVVLVGTDRSGFLPIRLRIIGRIWGERARNDEWLRDPHESGKPRWFVPQAALDELPVQ